MSEFDKRLQDVLPDTSDDERSAFMSLLDTFDAPASNTSHKAQMITLLSAHLPQPQTRLARLLAWYPIAVLRSQVRIIQHEIWTASALTLLIGVVITFAAPNPSLLSLSILAPIVAAVGIGMLYDNTTQAMLDVEETSRASAPLLLLARLTLVFGFDLCLSLLGSIILVIFGDGISLSALVMSWLAPMTFLSGLAFFISIFLRDTLLASSTSLVLWVIHVVIQGEDNIPELLRILSMSALSNPHYYPYIVTSGLLFVVAALWILQAKERQVYA
ncbi:MAG: hypothetical protein AAFQ52_12570 [Chloroflexota bacterium]